MTKGNAKIIVPILIVVELCFSFLAFQSYLNKGIVKEFIENKVNKKNFALYVQQEDGEYKEIVDSNYFPGVDYELNEAKSICVDREGEKLDVAISFKNNKLSVTSNKTIYCHMYFDVKVDVVISVITDGVEGVIPDTNGYDKTINCSSGSATEWDYKYNRLEFSNLVTDDSCSIIYTKDTSNYDTLKSVVENNANIRENGYRYNEKNPNNYLWFNNELYRIIGSIPVKLSDGTTTNLVKIIRNNSIGGLEFDVTASGKSNIWGSKVSLYNHLNTHFYASNEENLNGQNSAGCYMGWGAATSMCDYAISGIVANDNYGVMVENVYWNVGLANIYMTASELYANEITNQSTLGHVGLMSASDYAYAASSNYYGTYIRYYSGLAITSTNWLGGQGTEWILTSNSEAGADSYPYAMYLNIDGSVAINRVLNGAAIRPVMFLKEKVYVTGGDGSSSNPYQIAMI